MEETDAKVSPQGPAAKVANLEFAGDVKMAPPTYKKEDKVATRKAYGTALTKLGAACDRVCAFDGDTKNSTFSLDFAKVYISCNTCFFTFVYFSRCIQSALANASLQNKIWQA